MGEGGSMKIKISKVGEAGAKLLLIGMIMVGVDVIYRLLTFLVAEEWRFLVGGVVVMVIGGSIVIFAAIAELREKGEI
jgi:hypothetical protein